MKKINMFFIMCLLVFLVSNAQAQSYQMPKWPMNGKEVDFVSNQVNTIVASPPAAQYASNGYYGASNQRLFRIIDKSVKWGNETAAPNLIVDDPFFPYQLFPEIVVAPKTDFCCDNGEYYVFYAVKRDEAVTGQGTVSKYNIMYNTINPNDETVSSATSIFGIEEWQTYNSAVIGLGVTDFIPNTQNRRLYYVYHSDYYDVDEINFFEVTPTGINGPYTVASSASGGRLFEAAEVEISSDMSKLVFVRPKKFSGSNNGNDLTIVHLNPATGYLNTSMGSSGFTYVDISTTNSTTDKYLGVEFNADEDYLYISRQGSGVYKYPVAGGSAQLITGSSAIADSQLERARDGKVYGVALDGWLYSINSGHTCALSNFYIGTSGVITNTILSSNVAINVRPLPDQIDKYDYSSLFGTELECCYITTESEVKTPNMTGVSHNSTTGDITIHPVTTSPYYVSWTQTSNPFTSGGVAITDVYLKGSLSIEPGARLNITGLTLHFKESEIVQMSYNPNGTGSRLFLYNSKLTAFDDCEEDNMWGGVRCSGNYAQAQGSYTTSKQPYTYMSNSTIEYATTGVEANTGGILRAYNSNFKDNVRDVKFISFTTNDNISEFGTCNFYTTEALYAKGFTPACHIEIWTAPGVLFRACNFSNDYAASVPLSQWGVGILATSSSITVDEKCTNPFQQLGTPCPDPSSVRGSFTNLYYGIKANIGDFMTVSRQDFNNCLGGAWLIACDAIKVTECNFDVSAMNPYQGQGYNFESYGLYVANSTGYKIEGNDFYDGILGLVVYASGEDENLVYRNNFENLSGNGQASGFVGIGISYDYADKYGLQLQCNNFTDVDYAMTVLGGDVYGASGQIISVTQSDIRSTQGMEPYGYGQFSTHNHFDGIPLNEDRFFVVDPNVSALPYYAYNQENVTGYMLGTYSSNIHVFNQTVIPTCAQTIYTGGIVIEPLMQSIGGLNDEQSELENQLNSLTSYNDLSLSISAQSANDNNTAEVYSQLSSASPYLTSEILLAYLENPNVPELSKVSLMLENSPLPTDVLEAIENSSLSAEYIDYILKQQDGVNEIEQLQNRISGLQSARQVNYDHLMRATFNADTTEVFAETYNYVMEFMQTQNDYHAKNRLVDMYIHSQMWDEALNLLSVMESSLSAENIAMANDIHLTEIKIDILQNLNTEPIADIVKRHDEFLTEMAADYNTKEGGVARAILESAGLMENFPIVFLPNPDADSEVSTKSARISEPSQEPAKSGKELAAMFKLYPNPANDYLSLEFINPAGNCSFNIYTLKGELVKSISSEQSLGFVSINISDLQPGNYIVNCPELNSNQNFMIVR